MGSHSVLLPRRSHSAREYCAPPDSYDREGFVEAPEKRNRATRGLITGVVLGAGLWGAILVLTGVIKL